MESFINFSCRSSLLSINYKSRCAHMFKIDEESILFAIPYEQFFPLFFPVSLWTWNPIAWTWYNAPAYLFPVIIGIINNLLSWIKQSRRCILPYIISHLQSSSLPILNVRKVHAKVLMKLFTLVMLLLEIVVGTVWMVLNLF